MATFAYTQTSRGTHLEPGNMHVKGNFQADDDVTINGLSLTGAPVQVQRIKLVVSAGGAAGVHTGSVTIPAGSILVDVIVHSVALWNAGTSAAMIVGDAADPNGFFDAINLKATDLLAGESINFSWAGGQHGADLALDYTSVATIGASQVNRRYLATARVVTAELTLVGTTATTGETYVDVVYAIPSTAHITTATFVAS